jgi:hypothetical protein
MSDHSSSASAIGGGGGGAGADGGGTAAMGREPPRTLRAGFSGDAAGVEPPFADLGAPDALTSRISARRSCANSTSGITRSPFASSATRAASRPTPGSASSVGGRSSGHCRRSSSAPRACGQRSPSSTSRWTNSRYTPRNSSRSNLVLFILAPLGTGTGRLPRSVAADPKVAGPDQTAISARLLPERILRRPPWSIGLTPRRHTGIAPPTRTPPVSPPAPPGSSPSAARRHPVSPRRAAPRP